MLPLLFLAFLTLSVPAQGQDPCPSASGPGADRMMCQTPR